LYVVVKKYCNGLNDMTTPTNDISYRLYEVAFVWVKDNEPVSSTTLIPLATHLMAAVQKMTTKGNGGKKKLAVLHVIKRLVNDTIEEEEKRATMLAMINTVLPPAIDAIIMLTSSGALRKWWKSLQKACCRR